MQSQSDVQQAQQAQEVARQAAREAAQQVREIQQAMREGAQEGAAVSGVARDIRQGIRDGFQEGGAGVEVRNTEDGKVVLITDAQGNTQRIVIGPEGQVVSGIAAPGVATVPPPRERKQLPEGLVDMMAIIFTSVTIMSLGTPLVKAWARRFEKRHEVKQQVMVEQRLEAIERAIDSVAVEVERISEGQRFTTKLLADRAPAEMERVK